MWACALVWGGPAVCTVLLAVSWIESTHFSAWDRASQWSLSRVGAFAALTIGVMIGVARPPKAKVLWLGVLALIWIGGLLIIVSSWVLSQG